MGIPTMAHSIADYAGDVGTMLQSTATLSQTYDPACVSLLQMCSYLFQSSSTAPGLQQHVTVVLLATRHAAIGEALLPCMPRPLWPC